MKIRNLVMSLGAASALAAAPVLAQTTVIVDPSMRPNTAVVITDQTRGNVVSQDLPGTHLATDQYGRSIIVDDTYGRTAGSYTTDGPQRRSIFDSNVDHATGTVTTPGYMGPRDSSGQ